MKIKLLFLLAFLSHPSFSQDTLILSDHGKGAKRLMILDKLDTTILSYYDSKKLESTQKKDPKTGKVHYIRYYINGKIMWDKEMINGTENGICTYYSKKGDKISSLNYFDGKIKDTVYFNSRYKLLIGNISFSSTVYGGAENEDGTSNVSSIKGPYTGLNMKMVVVDSLDKNYKKEYFFITDYNGDFIVDLPSGVFGFFPSKYLLNDIFPGQYMNAPENGMSGSSSWDLTGPVIIKNSDKLKELNFRLNSVGYAP